MKTFKIVDSLTASLCENNCSTKTVIDNRVAVATAGIIGRDSLTYNAISFLSEDVFAVLPIIFPLMF